MTLGKNLQTPSVGEWSRIERTRYTALDSVFPNELLPEVALLKLRGVKVRDNITL